MQTDLYKKIQGKQISKSKLCAVVQASQAQLKVQGSPTRLLLS